MKAWRTLKTGLCALAGAAGVGLTADPALADPAIWKVGGPHASVFIVGSTPTAPADGRWRTAALQSAAAGAQEIWFINSFGAPGPITILRMVATIQTQGSLPPGEHLMDKLGPEDRARLGRLAARYNLSLEKLDRMAPWYAFVTLELAVKNRTGASKGSPVEQYVIATAPRGTPKRGFDNLEDDLKLLTSTPQSEQIYDLKTALKRDDDPGENQRYGEAWAGGDLNWIERERENRLRQDAPVTYQRMQIEPRRRWADRIAALAQGSKTAIVVLDAADLVGQNGLPAMLRRKGLQLEGP